MDAAATPPSYPFHLARAYAASAPARPATHPTAAYTTANGLTVRPSGDSVQITARRSPQLEQSVARLAAAKVDKAPDFVASAPAPTSSGLPMYRHPADKNIAATGVQLGKAIDFSA
jgi:hypothetical protein